MPIVYERKQLQYAVEATPGTAETTGFSAIDCYDFKAPTYKADYLPVKGQRGFGGNGGVMGARSAEISFKFDVKLKAGADAAWMTLLGGCGFVLNAGVWKPTSVAPGGSGGHSCFTFRFQQDGREQVVFGAAGSMKFSGVSGGKITVEATFVGIPAAPSDAAMATLTLPASEITARLASVAAFTIGGTSVPFAEISLDLGATAQLIQDASTASGYRHAVITNRETTGSVAVLAGPNSGFRPLLRALASTTGALSWRIGDVGAGITIAAPSLQFTGEADGDRNGVLYDVGSFAFNRATAGGDDDITFDGTA